MLLKKLPPKKSPFASTLLRFYASRLLRFYASTLLRFFASTLLKKLPPKKSPFASTLLRFYASRTIFPKKIILCFYASSLLCFQNNFPQKNHPLLLRFFASMLPEQFSPKKSSFASTLLRFFAFRTIFLEEIILCFYASTLLCF